MHLPLPPDTDNRVLHGFANNEDAVILRQPPIGMALVQTVDVIAPIGNNARLFGQTAAANALSDVYAMGGEPWSAMNILSFPTSELPLNIASEILTGGLEKLTEAGAVFAGGHTLEDKEIKYGLAVTGKIDPQHIARNNALQVDDVLILTKPLGTGILATAIKANWIGSEESEKLLYHWTTHLNRYASEVLREMNLQAATDITGFGLGGHLLEMAKASHVAVEINCSALPFMDHVLDYASEGLIPAGTYHNRKHCACHTHIAEGIDDLQALLTFDAQTSGGLILALQPERVEEAKERLAEKKEAAWQIGKVHSEGRDQERLILA